MNKLIEMALAVVTGAAIVFFIRVLMLPRRDIMALINRLASHWRYLGVAIFELVFGGHNVCPSAVSTSSWLA